MVQEQVQKDVEETKKLYEDNQKRKKDEEAKKLDEQIKAELQKDIQKGSNDIFVIAYVEYRRKGKTKR